MLPIRQRRQQLMPSPLLSRVWLSFVAHTASKLNHTLFSPPPSLLFVPRSSLRGHKKAAGMSRRLFVTRLRLS
jgi:hypothetical protein